VEKGIMSSGEIIFEVMESIDGGYEARAIGHSIFTAAESEDELKVMLKDAVSCHFEDAQEVPRLIRLHWVRDEVIPAWNYLEIFRRVNLLLVFLLLGMKRHVKREAIFDFTSNMMGAPHHITIPAHQALKSGLLALTMSVSPWLLAPVVAWSFESFVPFYPSGSLLTAEVGGVIDYSDIGITLTLLRGGRAWRGSEIVSVHVDDLVVDDPG
jgi:hypothetical protein